MANQITHKELLEDLDISFKTNTPAFISGSIGIGKSMTVMDAAKNYAKSKGLTFAEYSSMSNVGKTSIADGTKKDISKAFIFFDVRSASLDPSDIKGLPNLQGTYVNWLPDIIFRIASREDFNGVIFFDEMNQAVPAVQSALYQVILDNSAGTLKLSDNCMRIGAGNRTKDKSNVNRMSMALQARLTNTELAQPSASDWVKNFAIPNGLHKNIISYIQYKPDHLNISIDQMKDQINFANPRAWERLSKQITELDKLHTKKDAKYFEQVERIADWNIGGVAAATFAAYMKLHSDIDIQQILDHPELIASLELDRRWFALDMISTEYGKHGKKIIEKVGKIMQNIDGDFAWNLIEQCKKTNSQFMHNFKESIEGGKWAMKNVSLFIN